MFRVGQIIAPTTLIKKFSTIARHLAQYPQALLVTQRSGKHLVLIDAELFDQMMERCAKTPEQLPPETGLQHELDLDYSTR